MPYFAEAVLKVIEYMFFGRGDDGRRNRKTHAA